MKQNTSSSVEMLPLYISFRYEILCRVSKRFEEDLDCLYNYAREEFKKNPKCAYGRNKKNDKSSALKVEQKIIMNVLMDIDSLIFELTSFLEQIMEFINQIFSRLESQLILQEDQIIESGSKNNGTQWHKNLKKLEIF
jgi:hypothetical protein